MSAPHSIWVKCQHTDIRHFFISTDSVSHIFHFNKQSNRTLMLMAKAVTFNWPMMSLLTFFTCFMIIQYVIFNSCIYIKHYLMGIENLSRKLTYFRDKLCRKSTNIKIERNFIKWFKNMFPMKSRCELRHRILIKCFNINISYKTVNMSTFLQAQFKGHFKVHLNIVYRNRD